MPRLFVFAIGGTGARVLRSLTFLLAAGIEPRDAAGNEYEIIPMMIDPDAANGNVAQTVRLLETYQAVRGSLSSDLPSDTFFHASIKELSSLNIDGGAALKKGYTLTIPNIDGGTFGNFIQHAALLNKAAGGDGTKEFLDLLYTNENLNTNLNIGFQGFPNMGAVVMNQFTTMPAFQFFANVFSPGDRIFIISSIFGGTGAAGFPLLVKNLRAPNPNLPNFATINAAPLGAIAVQPYFNLTSDANSPIDASQFITKTKAALTYYQRNLTGVDSLYYIGENSQSVFNNVPGGNNQENQAHFVELASALAIFDFLKSGNSTKEFGLASKPGKAIDFSHLAKETKALMEIAFIRTWILGQYIEKELINPSAFAQKFYTTKPIIRKDDMENNLFFKAVNSMSNEFKKWLTELSSQSVAFEPFYKNDSNRKRFLNSISSFSVNGRKVLRDDMDKITMSVNDVADKYSSQRKEDKFIIGLSEAFTRVLS